MTKYIGLTIGPIYKTMLKAKKTRELWGASYLFSYLMKNIIAKMQETYQVEFVLPYVKAPDVFAPGKEVGLFHDRFIAKVHGPVFDDLDRDVITPLLLDTGQKMATKLGDAVSGESVAAYLKTYLNIYYCEIESGEALKQINEKISRYLDVLELQAPFIPDDKDDHLMGFLYRVNASFLIEDAFGQKRHSFYSIPEIASRDVTEDLFAEKVIKLKKKTAPNEEDTDDTDIYKQIKEHKKEAFRTHHKYIAIVQADGDDLGKAIAGLDSGVSYAFENFSKALFTFAGHAHDIIRENGGTTIYAGGDDLLFFAPVVYKGRTVFDLCHDLGNCFRKNMAEGFGRDENLPTLSFGISISYYKYPMYEAMEAAQTQLFGEAKGFPGKYAIAFQYLKHSGTFFNGVLSRRSEIYPHFRALIRSDLDQEILTSIIHDTLNYRRIILEIGRDRERLAEFFNNQYNEDIHGTYNAFFESVGAFIHEVCCTCKYTPEEKINLIHSVLRLKKNLKGEEEK